MKKKIFIIIGVISILLICVYYYNSDDEEIILKPIAKEIVEEPTICFVDVKGEVVNPGVYECVKNDKVIDLINKAGGLTKNADTSVINLSKIVSNEMLVIIYSNKQISDAKKRLNEPTIIEVIREIEKECICPDVVNDACEFTPPVEQPDNVNEEPKEEGEINEEPKETSKININTATKEILMTLPGIGDAKARAIINYRTTNKFETIEDITKVTGIGDAIFNDVKELIEV